MPRPRAAPSLGESPYREGHQAESCREALGTSRGPAGFRSVANSCAAPTSGSHRADWWSIPARGILISRDGGAQDRFPPRGVPTCRHGAWLSRPRPDWRWSHGVLPLDALHAGQPKSWLLQDNGFRADAQRAAHGSDLTACTTSCGCRARTDAWSR